VILLLSGPAVTIAVLRHELVQRREAEQKVREQGELQHLIFDQAPGGVVLGGLDFRMLKVNEAFCRMLGYTREELAGLTFVQITHPDDVAENVAIDERLLAGQHSIATLEKRYIRKDSSILHAALSVGLIRDERGTPLYFVAQITDITERKRAEAELQTRQRQLDTILTNTPIVLYAINSQGRYLLCEGAGLSALGRKPGEAVGQSAFDLYASRPDIISDFRRGLAGETFTSQREYNGAVFELRGTPLREADGRISGVIGIALDITERVAAGREKKNMERKLLEVQKLESLGVLAGGVAHDFNNLLTAILGNASLIRLELGEKAPVLSNLTQIEQASRTAAGLCQQLLAYAGRSRLDATEADLSQLVRETTDLLRVSVGNHAQLRFTLAEGLPGISADIAQIRQVLLNIVLNAAEALGRRDGVIEVATRRQTVDTAWLAEARIGHDLRPGEYVCLDVTDNGPGLSPETQARIFDPFFSTKGSGRGLGLAAALGIMRSHQGALRLTSQPGHGTSFTLAFPVSATASPKTEPARPANGKNWRGHGSVLIVDDEEAVRGIAAQMVAYYGFEVKQAESGQQALDLVRARPEPFDLVLLDLTMPGMDGFATFTALRELRPDQRIVIFSGYSAHDARQRFAGQNLNGFLQKPFSADALREILTQVPPK
jgi:PAS domain S-box-containing protein